MLNHSASLAMSTSILEALPGKLDIKDTHQVFSIFVTFNKGLTVATVIPCEVLTNVTICGCPEAPLEVTLPALCTVIICLDPGVNACVPPAAFSTVLPGAATLIV